jgi:hypothetical protein
VLAESGGLDIVWVLKIVLGGTTARRNTRCGGLYLFAS